jgi:hypothetical protein
VKELLDDNHGKKDCDVENETCFFFLHSWIVGSEPTSWMMMTVSKVGRSGVEDKHSAQ